MIPDKLAVILVEATIKKVSVASPCEPGVLLIGIFAFDDTHVTDVVKSLTPPSVNVPVAMNCWIFVTLREITAEVGVTVIDTSSAGVMVSVVTPDMLPNVAVMVVEPTPTDVARPCVPVIVETRVSEELHTTDDVISCVVLSEKVPVAINCWVVPRTMLGFAGVTVTDVSTAGVTVSVAAGLDVTPENTAEMTVDPSLTAVASPFEPETLLMVATAVFEDDQVAHVVRS